jgi:hypothetical protein
VPCPRFSFGSRKDNMNRTPQWNDRLFDEGIGIVKREGAENGFRMAILALYEQQTQNWPALAEIVQKLENASSRTVPLDGRKLRLQHNPARIINVNAPTSAREVAERPCPLCPPNMPSAQKALPFLNQWLVVCNPLPLFKQHFVLVSEEHTPQCSANILPAMIEFTRLTGFTTLYNGPRSGASIPDHLHLQAAPPGCLPIEEQLPQMDGSGIVVDSRLPRRIFLDASDTVRACHLFERTLVVLDEFKMDGTDSEPGMNIAVTASGVNHPSLVAVHPRIKHRPQCFYARDEARYVVSPGSADMAGMLILPRQEDYERLDGPKVESIFREVCLQDEQLASARKNLQPKIQSDET